MQSPGQQGRLTLGEVRLSVFRHVAFESLETSKSEGLCFRVS